MGKITRLSLEDIEKRIEEDYYKVKLEYPKRPEGYKKENYVYDENQTVKWNREHQVELTNRYQEDLKDYHQAANAKDQEFQLDMQKAINQEYGFSVKQIDTILSKAWENGHADGLRAVVNEARELADFALDIIKDMED